MKQKSQNAKQSAHTWEARSPIRTQHSKLYIKKQESSLGYKIWLVKHHSDAVEFAVSCLCSCKNDSFDLFVFVQVWPISCTLGATIGFLTGLLAAPVWIHWHRKQLTYKLKWVEEGQSQAIRNPEKEIQIKVKNDRTCSKSKKWHTFTPIKNVSCLFLFFFLIEQIVCCLLAMAVYLFDHSSHPPCKWSQNWDIL